MQVDSKLGSRTGEEMSVQQLEEEFGGLGDEIPEDS